MIFDKLFLQYMSDKQKPGEETWWGSRVLDFHGRLLIGKPEANGLTEVDPKLLRTYYFNKTCRFKQPKDVIEFRQQNNLLDCMREAERKVVAFGASILGIVLVLCLSFVGVVVNAVPSGGDIKTSVKWLMGDNAEQLAMCEEGEVSGEDYLKACRELREAKQKKDREEKEAKALLDLTQCFKRDDEFKARHKSGGSLSDEEQAYVDGCNTLASEFPEIVSQLQEQRQ